MGPGSTHSETITSWSGHALIIKSNAGRRTRLELVDADSFQTVHSWVAAEDLINFTDADNAVAIQTHGQIRLSGIDGTWRTIYTIPDLKSCGNQLPSPKFIENKTLVLLGCGYQTTAIDTSGRLLFKEQLSTPHRDFLTIANSQDGRFFGALLYKSFCAANWFECLFDRVGGVAPERMVICDASDWRAIY